MDENMPKHLCREKGAYAIYLQTVREELRGSYFPAFLENFPSV